MAKRVDDESLQGEHSAAEQGTPPLDQSGEGVVSGAATASSEGIGGQVPPPDASEPVGEEAMVGEEGEVAEAAEDRISRLEDNLLRTRADYQNLQRRNAIEKAEAIRFANADLMRSLLGVLDDLERSLASFDAGDDPGAVVEGVRLVQQNFDKALRDHGMSGIDAVGMPFDPRIHEAMMQQPSEDHDAGTVLEEIARGYQLHDRVLRPAKVIVSGGGSK